MGLWKRIQQMDSASAYRKRMVALLLSAREAPTEAQGLLEFSDIDEESMWLLRETESLEKTQWEQERWEEWLLDVEHEMELTKSQKDCLMMIMERAKGYSL